MKQGHEHEQEQKRDQEQEVKQHQQNHEQKPTYICPYTGSTMDPKCEHPLLHLLHDLNPAAPRQCGHQHCWWFLLLPLRPLGVHWTILLRPGVSLVSLHCPSGVDVPCSSRSDQIILFHVALCCGRGTTTGQDLFLPGLQCLGVSAKIVHYYKKQTKNFVFQMIWYQVFLQFFYLKGFKNLLK